jgi:hypothetical protein
MKITRFLFLKAVSWFETNLHLSWERFSSHYLNNRFIQSTVQQVMAELVKQEYGMILHYSKSFHVAY